MSIYLGENLISGTQIVTDKSERIGQIITSTIPLTDAGLHLLDGALISGNGSYADFVEYIGDLYDAGDYPDLFCSEADWQTAVTDYGVCGKFVYDSVNNTVRLPKITGIIESTTDLTALGDLVEAGLPKTSISVPTTGSGNNSTQWHRAELISNGGSLSRGGLNNDNWQIQTLETNTSSIYGNSNTVQPQTIKTLYYIVIATSTQTQIQVDIDEIATDLNGKADVDLTNVNNSGTSKGAGWAMPSSTYTALTVGASGSTYTAPANGWFVLSGTSTSNSYAYVQLGSSSGIYTRSSSYSSVTRSSCYLPAKKGDIVTIYYANESSFSFVFIYAVGSESEAS